MSRYGLTERAPLKDRNTFRVRAQAELLAEVHDATALADVFEHPRLRSGPVLVLGAGSNVLLADEQVEGVVLAMSMRGVAVLDDTADTVLLRAEAGVVWDDVVRFSLDHGLAGLENLVSIPGTVGAAPVQNIGAYGVELSEFVECVDGFERDSSRLHRLGRRDCGFGYRDSRFKREADTWIVTALQLRLPRRRGLRLEYAGVREELEAMQVTDPRPAQVAEAIARIRSRKLPDPARIGNAGSFFKNPVVPRSRADALRTAEPGLPVHAIGPDAAKLSAAWMIERCGWRGHRDGDAGISGQHALVLVNHGDASGAQLLGLARRVAASVHERFGIALEPEPRIVGAPFRPSRP